MYATIELYTKSSLENDNIPYRSVKSWHDEDSDKVIVHIASEDPSVKAYEYMHPKFIANYKEALKGIDACKSDPGCWNKHDTIQSEPWAFFPQFGLPLANQKSILLLNYPPYTALTKKSYLKTFTINRWSRVMRSVGVEDPTLYETIVDIRPIAAPGSATSQYLPDGAKFFNDSTQTTGGFYISPQLALMLNPPSNTNETHTLPLVVLGGPARGFWGDMLGIQDSLLTTGTVQLPGISKKTPYLLGNHPDVTTYQKCVE